MGNKGISFQLMIVLISKALIQKEKKNSITVEVAPTLPLLFLYYFLFFCCL